MVPQYAVAIAELADDSGGEAQKAGPIALVVILLLAISCYFLFRSMTRHLKRVRENFPDSDALPPPPPAPSPEGGQTTASPLGENGTSRQDPPPG